MSTIAGEIHPQVEIKNRNYMLHILRNPYGWGEEVVREVRLKAADELERLYRVESAAMDAAHDFKMATSKGNA